MISNEYELVIGDKAVTRGEHITDFRGKDWVFEYVSRMPEPGKSGKVIVHSVNHPDDKREFYPTVFGDMGETVFIRGVQE